jgi:hypothetical protein
MTEVGVVEVFQGFRTFQDGKIVPACRRSAVL